MNIDDQAVYYIDPTTLCWAPFFNNLVLGVRKYLLEEDTKTLQKALKKHFL